MAHFKSLTRVAVLTTLALLPLQSAFAQHLLIRGATVHTATAQGTLQNTDVLVRDGKIAAIGTGLSANGATVVEAAGKPLTPALFAGLAGLGLEDVSGESATVDHTLTLGDNAKDIHVRPEFDVSLAYNPDAMTIAVTRVEGFGFGALQAGSGEGGSLIGGQGSVVRLDGSADPLPARLLYINLGGAATKLSGGSRAGQWMLLEQLIDEARGRIPADANSALLTPAGRSALLGFLNGQGRIVFKVDRASDIRQLLRFSQRHRLRIAIDGGAEAWRLAPQLAAADVPVFVDVLDNLPSNFDRLHATLENAARLHAAGVQVSFNQSNDATHNARKIRQLAGNAVANGLPWEIALAGLTSTPAAILGVGNQLGSIAVGQRADLTLWNGDPLDIAYTAEQLWLDGRTVPMRSRQTQLRDRYLRQQGRLPRAYPAAAEGH